LFAPHVWIGNPNVLSLEDRLALLMCGRRKYVADLTAHHGGDYLRFVQLAGGLRHHRFAIPQNCDAITDTKHFLELVGDVDHTHTASAQLFENGEQGRGFRAG
jgi:hypothetical protein